MSIHPRYNDGERRAEFWKRAFEAAKERADKAEDLLRRIAKANVIFPSMCANNMEAWDLSEELKQFAALENDDEPQRR